jgi:hypothetical protein
MIGGCMKATSIISNTIKFERPIKRGDSIFIDAKVNINNFTGKQELECNAYDLNGEFIGGSTTVKHKTL